MTRMPVIYVASAITRGDLVANLKAAHDAALALLLGGASPLVPHAGCFFGNAVEGRAFVPEVLPTGTTHAVWYPAGLALLRKCDAVVRLPGESVGADLEEAEARACGIPVYHSVAQCLAEMISRREP